MAKLFTATLNFPGEDNGTSVDVYDVSVNGSTVYIAYVDASGNLKVRATSTVQDVAGTLPVIMTSATA